MITNTKTQKYYFDTNALLKYYEPLPERPEKGILAIHRFVANSSNSILISPLTKLEFIAKLTYYFRCHDWRNRRLDKIVHRFLQDVGIKGTKPFLLVALPDDVFQAADTILLDYRDTSIGSNDALHLAIAQKLPCQPVLVTSDGSMKNVCEHENIPFCDPEIETL